MLAYPNAKINIGLHIINKRPDGYHNLESIFYPVPLFDVLEAVPSENFFFSVKGNFIPGRLDQNICIKAYHLLKENYDIPGVDMILLKNIPTGAGMGGGSSDGAYAIQLLNDLFKLELSERTLQDLALQLGSDCPFFISNKPAFVTGRGENIQEISMNLKGYYFAILANEIHISTAQAYSNIHPQQPDVSLEKIKDYPIEEWKDFMNNDFEEFAFQKFPVLKKAKDYLYSKEALFASMTGSGSAIFGIFRDRPNDLLFDGFNIRVVRINE